MNLTKTSLLTTLFCCLGAGFIWGQQGSPLWQEIAESEIELRGKRYLAPTVYQTWRLNPSRLEQVLAQAPMEGKAIAMLSPSVLEIPMPEGGLRRFRVLESPIMAPELAAQFPEIQTFAVWAENDERVYGRIDFTPQGFHAMIFEPGKSTIFIDPYSFGGGDIENYLVYRRADYASAVPKNFRCYLDEQHPLVEPGTQGSSPRFGDCRRRVYRLAVAATGEYTTFHGGTVALAQAAQVTTINRVNTIFERDLSVRMNLIANNNLLIYTNAATDPYTNGNTGAMITENQNNVTTVIGAANYDIGHVFGTNSGGLAGLGVVCNNTAKARGVTGSAAPVGDPFDVDYVAHEVGHQFRANHTQNNACNRNNATAMETGSGSTILSYAGICAPNVQPLVDDYFHAISLQEMNTFITSAAHTCPVTTVPANTAPVIVSTVGNRTIPAGTAFSLTATVTDPNGDPLTYTWEQMDNAVSTQAPVASSADGPTFRSRAPSTNPTRYFPALPSAANTTWEVIPTVTRTMNFRLTARDNAPGGGCTAHSNLAISTVGGTGPFVVVNPSNTGITWPGGSNQTVTWNVAGTDAAPVSCAFVNILLSTNGGTTYPIVLATNVPNDGSQLVLVPNGFSSTTCRVMVVCADNIFFDVSNNNFSITNTASIFSLAINPVNDTVCPGTTEVFNVTVGSSGGFATPVNLSVTGLPTGMTASFSSASVTPPGSSNLNLNIGGGVAPGYYQLTLQGVAGATTRIVNFGVWVLSPPPSAVTLTSPVNGATNQSTSPSFTWTAASGTGVTYEFQLSTDPAFGSILQAANGLTGTSHSVTGLSASTTYYWRVRAVNGCGASAYSTVFSFTTNNIVCNIYTSTNVPLTISSTGTPTINSTLNVPLVGTITDVNVLNLQGTHTYIQDLTVTLIGPSATAVVLWNAICTNQDNFNINLDDAAATGTFPCPPTTGGFVRPQQVLSAFNGQNPNGTWTLRIRDNADQDGGSLTNWALEICAQVTPTCPLINPNLTSTNVSCNGGNNGSVSAVPSGGAAPYSFAWTGGFTTATVNNRPAGTYTVTITDNNGCTATASATVGQPAALTAAATSTNATCNGTSTGSVTATGTGGTAPYSFIWTGGFTTATVNNRPAGTYTVTITDNNGCTATASATVGQPAALTAVTTAINATCNGTSTGSVTATGTGGTAPYSFVWTGGFTTATVNNRPAGTYTVTITDNNGCTATASATVGQPAALALSASSTPTTCALNDGTATVSATGGVGPYTFNWGGQTTATATALAPSVYTVVVTDANACTASTTATVNNGCVCTLAAAATSTNATCNGTSTGSVTATGTGGTAPYSFVWTGGFTTATVNNRPAGTYTVTITDNNGCTATASATVGQPAVLTAAATSTNATCNGTSTGSVTATGTGGTAPYSFVWTGGFTTATVNNRPAGTYTVTITDNNGCTATASATVGQPAALALSASSTPTTCALNDGTATVSATGGVGPYTFNWGGQTTATATALAPGVYTVVVTDANACTASTTATVNNGCVCTLAAATTSTNATCNGTSTGSVTATGTGGTAPYSFAWTGGFTTATVNNRPAGTYTVTITDNNGCTATASATVGQPAALTAAATSTNATCNGTSTGSVTATGTGGTAPYSFVWTGGFTTATVNNRPAGTYTVTITDNNGCTATASATVGQPAALALSASSTPTTCALNDGTATVSATGGVGPYTFNWGGQTTATATALAPGVYTVVVTDANACTASTTATVNNGCVCTLAAAATSTNATCNGTSTGSVTATGTGGTAPYSFVWTGGFTTATVNNRPAGTYTVTITDNNGCTATASATVGQPAALTAVTTAINATCNGTSTGSVTATGTGGTAPYSFVWTGGFTTATVNNLTAGTYTVTITDNNGCTATASATVGQPAALTAVTTAINATCNGSSTGSVTATGTGGTAPYSFIWTGGFTTATVNNRPAGTYTVTITDNNGCTATASATVGQPAALAAAATSTNATCNGSSTGSVTATGTGGTAPYSFAWTGGFTTATVNNRPAGTYTVTITDNNGCTATASATVGQPAALALSASSTPTTCALNDGTATVSATGGVGPYTFNWGGQTTSTATALAPGVYTVVVTDANACTASTTATVNNGCVCTLAAAATSTNATCNGSSTGSVTVTGTGGTAPYSFIWTGGFTTATVNNRPAGTYTVTITDNNGCTATASATVGQPAVLTAAATSTNATCNGSSTGSVTATGTGGTAPYSFVWTGGFTTATVNNRPAGTYTVTITDNNGCTATASATVGQPAALALSASSTPTTCALNDGTATVSATGGVGPYTFNWGGQTTATATALAPGVYTVVVTDANACTASTTATVNNGCVCTLAAAAISTNATCNGTSTGSVTAAGTGGTAPYSFIWTGGFTTATVNNRPAGTYTVTITDNNGCTATASATVGQPAALALSASSTPTTCALNDGTATVSATGGVGPYTFNWGGQTTATATALAPGVYTVVVTDANACTASTTATVNNGCVCTLAAAATSTNATCNGSSTGSVTATGTGGTAPYSFIWTGGFTTATVNNRPAGTYTVTITDNNGCTATASATVGQPAALAAAATSTNATCNGTSTGSVTATGTGGTAPYSFVWTGSFTTATVNNRPAGTYTVTITDNNGCTATASATVGQPAALALSASSTPTTCALNDGTATVSATGGVGPYTFNWGGQTTATATALAPGVYTVVVTDANACTASTTATVNNGCVCTLTAAATATNATCNGSSTGSVTATGTGGTAPYSFVWTGGFTTATVNNRPAGTYTVTITDNNGCTATASATVGQPAALALSASSTPTTCALNDGTATVSATGGVGPYSFNWGGQTTATATALAPGVYTVVVTDANACTASTTATVNNGCVCTLTAAATATNATCNGSSTGSVTAVGTGGTAPYSFAWTGGFTTATVNNRPAGTYTVTITDNNGCTATASATVGQPAAINLATALVQPSCRNACDASIVVTVNPAAGVVSFLWSDGQTSQNRSNLCPGLYSVTVTDANGCANSSGTLQILNPAAIAIVLSPTNDNCNGSQGAINSALTGGTAPYTYLWSNAQATANLNGLSSGTYSLTATDANGCTATASTSVGFTNSLSALAIVQQNVLCANAADGIATVAASGATNLSYLWSNGQNTATATGLSGGVHTVTVSSAGGCRVTRSVTLTSASSAISVTLQTSFTNCAPNSGLIIGLANGGNSSAYSFVWSNGQSGQILQGLSSASYTVTVTDASGCSTTQSTTIQIPVGPSLITTASALNCFGDSNGAVDLTVGPTAPVYQVLWSTGETTMRIENLNAGVYSVQVFDPATGCTVTAFDTVRSPSPIIIATAVNDASNNSNPDGNASATANGGTPGYTYLWSTGASGPVLDQARSGSYTVTATDANGCTASTSLQVGSLTSTSLTTGALADFRVFPNPAPAGQCHILIEWTQDTKSQVRILDVLGRTLWQNQLQGQSHLLQTPAQDWAPGTYFIELQDDKGYRQTRKLIIER